jgi:hypothetical protein
MDLLMMSADPWMLGLGRSSVFTKRPYFEQNGVKCVETSAVNDIMLDGHCISAWHRHDHCGESFKTDVEVEVPVIQGRLRFMGTGAGIRSRTG